MFDIGLIEVGVVLLVALFAIGPERMPEVATFLAKGYKFIKKISIDIRSIWEDVDTQDEHKNTSKSK